MVRNTPHLPNVSTCYHCMDKPLTVILSAGDVLSSDHPVTFTEQPQPGVHSSFSSHCGYVYFLTCFLPSFSHCWRLNEHSRKNTSTLALDILYDKMFCLVYFALLAKLMSCLKLSSCCHSLIFMCFARLCKCLHLR